MALRAPPVMVGGDRHAGVAQAQRVGYPLEDQPVVRDARLAAQRLAEKCHPKLEYRTRCPGAGCGRAASSAASKSAVLKLR